MGNASSSKAVNPSDGKDKNTQCLKQDAQEGNTSSEKFGINQQPQKQIEVKSKEQSSNEDIDTDQLPQQLMQGELEGYESNGHVNIDLLPPHWKDHVQKKPTACLTPISSDTPLGLTYIDNRSNGIDETIRCPVDMDDKAFDDFARKYTEKTSFEIPLSLTETTMKQKLYDCIKKCLKKKGTLIKMGSILKNHNRLTLEVQNLKEENEELQKLQAKKQKHQKKKSKKYLKRVHDEVEEGKVLTKEDSEELGKQYDSLNENLPYVVKENDQKSKNDWIRIHDQVEQERKKVKDLECKLKQIEEEKEHLLTRLSKIAGSKLTSNNPDIADLNDDNRPTKLAEKFSQLYDDAWTDSMEELTGGELRLDDRAAIGFLLRIVMTAYNFCSGSRSMFLDLTDCQTIMTCKDTGEMKVVTKLPEAMVPDIQQALKTCLRAKETTLISEMQEKFADTLHGILSDITTRVKSSVSHEHTMNPFEDNVRRNNPPDYCLHDFSTAHLQSKGNEDNLQTTKKSKKRRKKVAHSENADSSQPCNEQYSGDRCSLKKKQFCGQMGAPSFFQTISSSQFTKTTHFAERCVELCWFMQTTQPPIHLSTRFSADGMKNNDIFRAYMKSGKEVDYIVWPVMYLYENGPVLNKGIAQPK
ncbi:calponin homology domain-containing protein DDB_G0272472 isoform X2 [Magallana gigas]|uniref:calponin homology domain-containing protein DDB_G0272472 isoform X2 n=1 Tax=Magallana gigas TaxID=29159 RepID=UPI00333EEFD3